MLIDIDTLISLAHRAPEQNLHLIDLPYRLSSWALDRAENLHVSRDDTGAPQAWAVLQTPFWAIDIVADAGADPGGYAEALSWAVERARAIADDPEYGRPCWFVSVLNDQGDVKRILEKQGFADQGQVPVDPWSKVQLVRPAGVGCDAVALPAGYRLRALAGPAEVEAYVALHRSVFESKNMTESWRRRTLEQKRYRPELDLVVDAPDGALAAFCVGWFDARGYGGQPCGQIEPLGVAAEHRGLGLGRRVLEACCERLVAVGAAEIYVETDRQRDAALGVYGAAGFQLKQDVSVYRLDVV